MPPYFYNIININIVFTVTRFSFTCITMIYISKFCFIPLLFAGEILWHVHTWNNAKNFITFMRYISHFTHGIIFVYRPYVLLFQAVSNKNLHIETPVWIFILILRVSFFISHNYYGRYWIFLEENNRKHFLNKKKSSYWSLSPSGCGCQAGQVEFIIFCNKIIICTKK